MATVEKYQVATSPGDKGVRYQVRYRTPAGSTTRKRGFRTKREATDFATSTEAAKTAGTFIAPSAGRTTVAHWYGKYIDAKEAEVKGTTLAARKSAWNARVRDEWADVEIGRIDRSDVTAWVSKLKRQKVGAASIEAALYVLRGCLDVAIGDRALTTNPAGKIRAPKRREAPRGYLSFEQVIALAEQMPHRSDTTLVMFLSTTGLRWGEAVALKVSSFNMLKFTVTVSEAYAEIGGKMKLDTPKDGETRTVAFPPLLADDLARLMVGKGPDGLVFTAPKGGLHTVSRFRRRTFVAAVKRCQALDADFPAHLTPHDLRHTAASLAISEGATPNQVANMLGHSKPSITMDRYVGLFQRDVDQVSARMDSGMRAAMIRFGQNHASA